MPSISVAFRGLPKHQALCFLILKIKQMNVHKDHMPQMCTDQSTQSTHTINRWKQYKAVRRLNYQPFFPVPKPEQILDRSPQMLRHIVTVLTLLL